MGKISFVVPKKHSRSAGVMKRCTHRDKKSGVQCLKKYNHSQGHSYRLAPRDVAENARPKQYDTVSKDTKLDCLQMIEDPAYRKRLLEDLRERKLRPAVECMLWYYAKGKPKEMVEHSGTLSLQQELSALSEEELRQRALDVAKMLTPPSVH